MGSFKSFDDQSLRHLYQQFVIRHEGELREYSRQLLSFRILFNEELDGYEIVMEAEGPVMGLEPSARHDVAPLEKDGLTDR